MLGCLAAALPGCKKEEKAAPPNSAQGTPGQPVAVDQSSAKAAAKSFATALTSGDVAAAKQVSVGNDDQSKTLEKYTTFSAQLKKLTDAASEKFGKDNKLSQYISGLNNMAGNLEGGEVKEEGDMATITPKGGGMPVKMAKKDGKWSVDLGALSLLMQAVDFSKVGGAAKDVAEKINDKKISTADEALAMFTKQAGMGATTAPDMIPGVPKPSSGPAIPAIPAP